MTNDIHSIHHYKALHQVLRGMSSSANMADSLGVSRERLQAYEDFIKSHITDLLTKHYTILWDLLSPERWQQLSQQYFVEHPADHYELNQAARHFSEFLRKRLDAGEPTILPIYIELAEFEWQEFVAYSTAIELPQTEELAQSILNPTLSILNCDYPIATFVRDWRQAKAHCRQPPKLPDKESQIVFVWRNPNTLIQDYAYADEGLLFAFKMVHDGISYDQACKISGLPLTRVRKLIQRAAAKGIVLLPKPRTTKGKEK